MNSKQRTIQTYRESAVALAEKFNALGARVLDIEETFQLVGKTQPKVVEIGCGNGRDAREMVKRTSDYLGIDISEALVELARSEVPGARFEVVDMETFVFPQGVDIFFAFASLIHSPKEVLYTIFRSIYGALSFGGIFRLSMKYAHSYQEVTREDEFGVRTYYLYSREDIEELAEGFIVLRNEVNEVKGQKWVEVVLKK